MRPTIPAGEAKAPTAAHPWGVLGRRTGPAPSKEPEWPQLWLKLGGQGLMPLPTPPCGVLGRPHVSSWVLVPAPEGGEDRAGASDGRAEAQSWKVALPAETLPAGLGAGPSCPPGGWAFVRVPRGCTALFSLVRVETRLGFWKIAVLMTAGALAALRACSLPLTPCGLLQADCSLGQPLQSAGLCSGPGAWWADSWDCRLSGLGSHIRI